MMRILNLIFLVLHLIEKDFVDSFWSTQNDIDQLNTILNLISL